MSGLLADWQIRNLHYEKHILTPFEDRLVQPASYELTLSDSITVMRADPIHLPIEANDVPPQIWYSFELPFDTYRLDPDAFILASTNEMVHLPNNVAARVEGKSSLGRLGIAIHTTAGWIDPGFQGQITLELKNLGPYPVMLRTGQKIAQLAFFQMEEASARPYGHPDNGNAYQGQVGATGSVGTRG